MSDTQRAAIVTGAAGGIGRALVKGLLGAGIRVAAVDRTADGLAALAREAGGEGALLTIQADLSRDDAAADVAQGAARPGGQKSSRRTKTGHAQTRRRAPAC